jgi:hypothetical protein
MERFADPAVQRWAEGPYDCQCEFCNAIALESCILTKLHRFTPKFDFIRSASGTDGLSSGVEPVAVAEWPH